MMMRDPTSIPTTAGAVFWSLLGPETTFHVCSELPDHTMNKLLGAPKSAEHCLPLQALLFSSPKGGCHSDLVLAQLGSLKPPVLGSFCLNKSNPIPLPSLIALLILIYIKSFGRYKRFPSILLCKHSTSLFSPDVVMHDTEGSFCKGASPSSS